MRPFFVDVCGTLFHDDTTLGLLRHHFSRQRERRWHRIFCCALTSKTLRPGFAVLEKLTNRHLLKVVAIKLLRGEQLDDLQYSAHSYADELLSNRRIDEVWTLLKEPLRSGGVVLASASVEPIIAALGERLNTPYIATTLEHHHGVLTGRIAEDVTGKKLALLTAKYRNKALGNGFDAISDNFSDRSLLENATQAYVVLHRLEHRSRWRGLNAAFIENY